MKKTINNYENIYEIDIFGNVYSVKNNIQLKPQNHSSGYLIVNLSKNGKSKSFRIHRLVADAFIENKENKPFVNHINGNKHDNCLKHLEWVTHKENMKHAVDNDLTCKSDKNASCKLTEKILNEIFIECMNGEEINVISKKYNVNRNTISKGFKRIGKEIEWKEQVSLRKSLASLKRWKNVEERIKTKEVTK